MQLCFAFDVGHSSIGWSVLTVPHSPEIHPDVLGCGVVLFEKDSALASSRRQKRAQRRHIRATRKRIRFLRGILAQLGVLSADQLEDKNQAGGGHGAPWLLAARVLKSGGKRTLSWPELWDVLRWYAHNRGYDPMLGQEEDAEDTEKVSNARAAMRQYGTSSMAETVCAWLELDPLGGRQASHDKTYKNKNAAFPRGIVKDEVRRLLQAHLGVLAGVSPEFIAGLLDDHAVLPQSDVRLPKRYSGGWLFGRLAMRFDNRIIGACPISGEKLPLKECPEYYMFRWAMLLANIRVVTVDAPNGRALRIDELKGLNSHPTLVAQGRFTPAAFRRSVRELVPCSSDNLDQMFADATAEKNLVLDSAKTLVSKNRFLEAVWSLMPEHRQRVMLNRLRRGASITLQEIRKTLDGDEAAQRSFDERLQKSVAPKKPSKQKATGTAESVEEMLERPLSAEVVPGRAPYCRRLLRQAYLEIMSGKHPKEPGGCLFETPEIRRTRDARSLDEKTNNHLVRHRLTILERLQEQLLAAPEYGAGDPTRVQRLVIEVNRDLKDMSGKEWKEIEKEMRQRLQNHREVSERMEKLFSEGVFPAGTTITASLIRKARIAEDLDWKCPYTHQRFEPVHLVTGHVDLDHIIPRSQRVSDSLDSLVVTFSAVNKMKGARTALQFVEECCQQAVPGLENLHIATPERYREFVESLEAKRGHADDRRRKQRRKERLLIQKYDAKSADFTPGQLTQTSHLTRLGQASLLRPYLRAETAPDFIAIPGQVTAKLRAAWRVLGCLVKAAPEVLERLDQDTGNSTTRVKPKGEIRNITHLHHALDACVLGLAAARFPRNGNIWSALTERRPNSHQRAILESLGMGEFDASGQFHLRDLPDTLKHQLEERLCERRVSQHVPADMSGMRLEENTRGITAQVDGVIKLRQRKPDKDGLVRTNRTQELAAKVFGLNSPKLAEIKGVRVITDNYGVAIVDNAKLPAHEQFIIIPFAGVWQQLRAIRAKHTPAKIIVWRNGQTIRIPKGKRMGDWKLFSIKNNASGMAVDFGKPDAIRATEINVLLKSLLKEGTHVVQKSLYE